MESDIVIVGSGVAGLYSALKLPKDKKITIITKTSADECDSFLAQGGICVKRDDKDFQSFFEDTLKAGHHENDIKSVELMIENSRKIINDLISYGVDFTKKDNKLDYTKEGAHSKPRILYHLDITGEEITKKLLQAVVTQNNITLLEHTQMVDIIEEKNTCYGVVLRDSNNNIVNLYANHIILATGGIGGVYSNTTNFPHLTGDSLAIALKHNIKLKNPDYVQIHPTSLYTKKPGRSFLITESVRGEGGILLDNKGHRFTDELKPRDIVSKAIINQMKKDNTEYVLLSFENIDNNTIENHFPNIYKKCLDEGYDITKEPIPVVPAQHYYMGGIAVDYNSQTSMNNIYAVGETSCNGVHGKNRLASNSLLEALVFAELAATHIIEKISHSSFPSIEVKAADEQVFPVDDPIIKSKLINIVKGIEKYE
ncbi:MAG: L-aspartate oxidase [Anaerovoracaceae bacterium]